MTKAKSSRKVFATTAAAAMAASAIVPAASVAAETTQFSDVAADHWAAEAINYLSGKEILSGHPDGTFDPKGELTRAETAVILAKALDYDYEGKTTSFDDVVAGHWAEAHIAALVEGDVIAGFPGNIFKPNDPITRQDLARLIAAAYGFELNEDNITEFKDSESVSPYAAEAVEILASVGVVNGNPDGTFKPKSNITRAEAAMLVYKADTYEADVEVGDLAIENVKAINLTTVEVTFNGELDEVSADNFAIEGGRVTAATLSEDKKTVTLAVAELAYNTAYELVATDILVDGERVDVAAKTFTTPAVSALWELEVTPKYETVTANGADNTVIEFKLLNANGEVDTDADDIVLAIDATFGNLANSRVTIQDGVGQVVLASEFSSVERDSKITAQIIEAAGDYQDLIGKVAGETTVKFVPTSTESDPSVITFLDAESNQADRVVMYFDKKVSPTTFVKTNPVTGKYLYTTEVDSEGNTYTKQVTKDNVAITVEQGDEYKEIVGFRSVRGNDKAIEVILAKEDYLTDNAEVTVAAKLATTSNDKTFILTDARQPEVTSVQAEGLRTLQLKFSESIAQGQFKIDGRWSEGSEFEVEFGDFDAEEGIDNRDTAELTLSKYAVGTDGYTAANNGKQRYFEPGSHSLTVTNLYDFAGLTDKANVSTSQGLTFNVLADTTPATAEVVVESPEQIRVKFDKEVLYTADLNTLFTNAFEVYDTNQNKYVPASDFVGAENLFKEQPTFTVDEYKNEFVVELTKDWTELLTDSEDAYYNYSYRFNIEKDQFTNAANGVESGVLNLNLNHVGSPLNGPDNVSPEIQDILETEDQSVFTVVMDEPVKLAGRDNAGDTPSTQQVNGVPKVLVEFQGKDKDGKNVVIAANVDRYTPGQRGADKLFDVSTSGETLQALVNQGYSENWTVVVRSISDDIGNTAATLTKDFTIESERFEGAFQIRASKNGYLSHDVVAYDYNEEGEQDRIEITFTKAVVNTGGPSDLTNPANWTLNGQLLTDVATIAVEDANGNEKDGFEKVIITFNDERALRADSNTISVNKSIISLDGTKLTGVNEVVARFGNINEQPGQDEVDSAALATAVADAEALLEGADAEDYEEGALDAYETAIADAQAVLDNADATQAEVDAAVEALAEATTAFEDAKIEEAGEGVVVSDITDRVVDNGLGEILVGIEPSDLVGTELEGAEGLLLTVNGKEYTANKSGDRFVINVPKSDATGEEIKAGKITAVN